MLCSRSVHAADAAVAAAVFSLEHLISYCNHTKRCFGPTSRGQGRRLCHAIPNHRSGEVNPKQQLPFCCRGSFSCGAGLQSESRLLLCCAPVTRDDATHVYSSVHAADAAVAAAVFGLEHLISYYFNTATTPNGASALPPEGKAVACATRCPTTGLGR